MDAAIVARMAQDLGLSENLVAVVLGLLEKGATAPFIARYRKEATGGIESAQIYAIRNRMTHYKEIFEKRGALLKLLKDQGKLTDDLRSRIAGIFTKAELDDLFHRFKPRRRSRGTEALEKGLESLAEYLWHQEPDAWSLEEHADVFISPDKKVGSREEALQGASDILAEWIAENLESRKALREMLWNEGQVVSTVVPAKVDQKTKYTMYYNRREAVATIPSHRVLAIRRGSKEGILTTAIEGDHTKAIDFLISATIREKDSPFAPILERAVRDSYGRILRPLIETEVRAMIKERADREAIRVFQENLANLLNAPPAGSMAVMGVDPGKGQECHLAVVDPAGKLLEEAAINPAPSRENIGEGRGILRELTTKHNIQAIAVGSGAAARELELVLRQILTEEGLDGILLVSVNDAGLAIYASSRIAREELPNLSIAARCAVSLARRLQDPLAELVKIDPKLIGVGQYQHDVDQKELHRSLVQTVQACVNEVGVDVNAASPALLRHVAGLNDKLARKIIGIRDAQGPFVSRTALMKAVELDPVAYQQAAGFLRIHMGDNPLDRTAIHPETYANVEAMAAAAGVETRALLENKDLIIPLALENFITDAAGMPTLIDIREELLKPGRDPRRLFSAPKFRSDIKEVGDLKEGMDLEGSVTNVTNFGAFVDVGVGQDGLVHLSQMSNRFIRDPREAVKVGDIVQVKVLSVELETKRIGLSIKALLPAPPRHHKRPRRKPGKPAPSAESPVAPENGDQAAPPAPPAVVAATPRPNHPGRSRDRNRQHPRKRRPQHAETAQELQEPIQGPQLPEPSMQEKIAILKSKFRGIS
jgi:uncharacterized protein